MCFVCFICYNFGIIKMIKGGLTMKNNYEISEQQYMDTIKQTVFDPCAPGNYEHETGRKDIMIINQQLTDINPLTCGEQYCEPGYMYGPKMREYYLLHYVSSGKGTFITDRGTYSVDRGQIFVIRPFEVTSYQADKGQPWHYRWVGFMSGLDLSTILDEDVISAPECDYLFRLIMECEHMESLKEYFICAKVFEILALINKKKHKENNKSREYILAAKNFIEVNYQNPDLTVAQIADRINLDRSYFSTLFKKYMDKSPQAYLMDLRLSKAAELIAFKGMTTGDAAMACGYSDVLNFSRMFKKKFNVPPSKFSKRELVN